ncbi:MAG: TolC family protein [Acidobacteria bacterium]|jgi:HAE1 family hydrophobic/amphiphilic exporter-1|nr:TolC family protein [Acidobacteriota bacterium]
MSKKLFSVYFLILLTVLTATAQTPQTPPPTQQPTQQPTQPTQTQPQTNQPTTQQPTTRTQQQQQQPNLPTQPQPPGVTPSGQIANPNTVIQQTPTQNVGTSGGVAPTVLPDDPPPVAPNFEAPLRPLPSAERVGVDQMNQIPMTLEEAITLALQNNNDIDSSKINVQIAEFNLKGARGVYDPQLIGESYYERRTTPTASTIGGAGASGSVTQSDFRTNFGASGFSPFAGGSYTADFSAARTTTNNQNALLNPQFPGALNLTYIQPLWRGLRFDNNRRNIEIAKKNLSLTDAQFRGRAIEVIAQVEQAYWNLVFALRNLQVQIDAVKQARTQLESNQRLVSKGVLAPIDVVAATTQITTFEQSVYTAQEDVTRAENNLKTLMLPDRTSEIWSRPITPISEVSLEPPRVNLEIATAEALRSRPEITQLQTSSEINQIDERYFRDQTKPQINLVANYTSAGLAGTANEISRTSNTVNTDLLARINQLSAAQNLPPLVINPTTTVSAPPGNLVGGFFNSLGGIFSQRYPTYRLGVQIALPFGNRVAEANLGRSLAEATQIRNTRAQQEQIIEAEVRNSLQALRSAEARLSSALASRQSAEQLYESEQRQFRSGVTTFYLVLQRQTELLAARSRELQAQTDLNKAISEFQRATGTTLSANNVTVSDGANLIKTNLRRTTAFNSRFFTKSEDK